jgi:hypothetical protein
MRRSALAVFVVLALASGHLSAIGCSDPPTLRECRNVPEGGCPLAYGKACDDPACSAAYACLSDGTWQLDHTCPPRDGGADVGTPPKDAGVRDVELDVEGAFGGPGCVPLEPPDCPYGIAATCNSGCCGCEDLFVCRDGGWSAYGFCADGGIR